MNYYDEIKTKFIEHEGYKRIKDYSKNKHELETYYEVGRLLVDAQGGESRAKYGDGLVKEYSKRLTLELGKGYTPTNLKNMRRFYLLIQKGHTVCDLLSWSHYRELLSMADINEINYYVKLSKNQSLSVRDLKTRIKNKEYERLDNITKHKLITKKENSVGDFIKQPIVIKNKYNTDNISEYMLKMLIIENMNDFLKELGDGFCYIENEYKIKLGDRYNYIDLLLYNIEFDCYVVVELKATELKKEHIGQIKLYMNYIDKNIKKIKQDKTIGIIIAKRDNKYVIEYASDERIHATTYCLV